MDAAYELSKFIVSTGFTDLPQEVIDIGKMQLLDALAAILGGSRDEAARKLYTLVKEWGGRKESTIMVYGGRFPSPNAAFVNSTMANALDYDDIHERGHFHAGSVVIPSALAISEAKGSVDGRILLTAICVAVELGCRLGVATKPAKSVFMGGWSYGSLIGHFTGAAVAGKIINLNEEQLHNALGIAYNQTSGNIQCVRDGASTKKVGYGFASRGGISSALMAQKGITGAKEIFDESDIGFYNLYHTGCDRDALLKDLGQKFEMFDMSFKCYPCCRLNHPYIDAVIRLVKDNKIEAGEVEEIIPYTCEHVYQMLCKPEQVKRGPRTMQNAQFSLPWTMACAVVRGKVGISEFTEEALMDRMLLDMATKVNPILDPSLPDELAFATVKLRTKREIFESKTNYTRGGIQNPVTFEDIEQKLMDCAASAVKPMAKERLTELTHMVRDLEEIKNVGKITKLLS